MNNRSSEPSCQPVCRKSGIAPLRRGEHDEFRARRRDCLCIMTMRILEMEAVQASKSGHPGTPMALAPVAYWLWNRLLRFDPDDPIWPNRDRFVLRPCMLTLLLHPLLHRLKAIRIWRFPKMSPTVLWHMDGRHSRP